MDDSRPFIEKRVNVVKTYPPVSSIVVVKVYRLTVVEVLEIKKLSLSVVFVRNLIAL